MRKGLVLFSMNSLTVFVLFMVINSGNSSFSKNENLSKRPDHRRVNNFRTTSATQNNINQVQENNHPPIVKILAPKNNSEYAWNTRIPYTISISDQEDGESKYDEIAMNEVFLQVKYIEDTSNLTDVLNQAVQNDPIGLAAMKTSNCLNCHAFEGKLIGPSFDEISERYTPTQSNMDLLVQHIREGSSGVWGSTVMPTHSELTIQETQDIVHWILENAGKANIHYYVGIEGTFQLKPPTDSKQQGIFVLTATYTDLGSVDEPKQPVKGRDVIMIRGK